MWGLIVAAICLIAEHFLPERWSRRWVKHALFSLGFVSLLFGGVDLWQTQRSENEVRKQLKEVELRTRPKPFKQRLVSFLEDHNKQCMDFLRETRSKGKAWARIKTHINPVERAALDRFLREPEAPRFLSMEQGEALQLLTDTGMYSEVYLMLSIELVE